MTPDDVKTLADAVESLALSIDDGGLPNDPDMSPISCLTDGVASACWMLREIAEAIERLAIAVEDIRKGGNE